MEPIEGEADDDRGPGMHAAEMDGVTDADRRPDTYGAGDDASGPERDETETNTGADTHAPITLADVGELRDRL